MSREPPDWLIGRDAALQRLTRLLDATRDGRGGALVVSGEAGMGKSALLRAALDGLDACAVGWGTAVEGGGAPGFWPWTQAMTALVREIGVEDARDAAGSERHRIATLVPMLGGAEPVEQSERGRMLLLDATVAWLEALSRLRPVVVVLDDLQWADESSLLLLDLLIRSPRASPLSVLGAVRRSGDAAHSARVVALVEHADHVPLAPLDREAVGHLALATTGVELSSDEVDDLFRRAGGHPFFTRELALANVAPDSDEIPPALRDAVMIRVGRLNRTTQSMLSVASLCGSRVLPDVLAGVTGRDPAEVESACVEARGAGVLRSSGDGLVFTHDLFRETLAHVVDPATRRELHHSIGVALAGRAGRGGQSHGVGSAEVARHLVAGLAPGAVPDALPDAVTWTLRAVEAEVATLALAEGARHLRELRRAVADAALTLPHEALVLVLLREADILARDGRTHDARGLLEEVREACVRAGDADGLGQLALLWVSLGSRFAMRRDEVVAVLREAIEAHGDENPGLRARLTAALARELSHSVPEDRDLAGPLSEDALRLGRTTGAPGVLADCLLARHDLLWTPGRARERAAVTSELVVLTKRGGDMEQHAQALLLHANVLLEQGRVAYAPVVEESLTLLEELGQLRHRYTLLTRRACLDLLHGRLDQATVGIDEAAALGERLGEPDTTNVWMSQRLELVRARARPDELLLFAEQAVAHWAGAPVHAHAVAAGFAARAGDLAAARRHVGAVRDLGGWHSDRSYLWSVYVPELAHAAISLGEEVLAAELLGELVPISGFCGVNGALVAFAGSHAETAGRLSAALGDRTRSRTLLEHACAVYERLGAGRLADARAQLETLAEDRENRMWRQGEVWQVTFAGRTVAVRDSKGMHDLAVLLGHAGADVHVLELVASPVREESGGAIIDRTAAEHYRRRLNELAARRHEVVSSGDEQRLHALDAEHDALSEQLRGGTGLGGRAREFANRPAERARKAVTARIRDAVRRIGEAHAELGVHLDRHVETGLHCRYTGRESWRVDAA